MRTDSTRISDIAKAEAVEHITSNFGTQYVRSGAAGKAKASEGQNIQDAHEAVRPTDVSRTPDNMKEYLNPQQFKLYDLIWRRFVASQMSAAKFKNTRAEIEAGEYVFRASGSLLLFDGFQKVWKREDEKEKEKTPVLPDLVVGDQPACSKLELEQHFTQPPPRYTEASLIKELEEQGIGRPSTYAPTIETIQERNYVRQEERRLHPTEVGKTVDSVLREHFPDIVDVAFTADLEKRLDAIEAGSRQYAPTVRDWYKPFDETVVKAESTMERVKIPAKETGETCPECEVGQLVVREGKFGQFVGCSRYPECKYIKDRKTSTAEPTGEDCPDCGKPLVKRVGRRGPFIGCSGYPSCRYVRDDSSAKAPEGSQPEEPLGNCPDCSKPLAHKRGRRGPFVGCTGYPSCTYIRPSASTPGSASSGSEPTGEDCPECGKPLVTRKGRFGPFVSCSGYPTCKYRPPKKVAAAS
jgi:DNA topoisomerase-1